MQFTIYRHARGTLFFDLWLLVSNKKHILEAQREKDKLVMASLSFLPPPFPTRHISFVQSSSERQLLFNRIAPVYDNVNFYLLISYKHCTIMHHSCAHHFHACPPLVLSLDRIHFIFFIFQKFIVLI